MPNIPPPPPPEVDDDVPEPWTDDVLHFAAVNSNIEDVEDPYAIALFDYFTDHPDDLNFSVSIFLIIAIERRLIESAIKMY